MAKSIKEINIDQTMLELATSLCRLTPQDDNLPIRVLQSLIADNEVQALQDYANTVSISRLGFNDHGPVHMRTVCCNALRMLRILHDSHIETTLVKEQTGTFEDSATAVILAAFLHDIGMTVGRQDHELYSGIMAYKIIDNILSKELPQPNQLQRRIIIRSMAMEGILGHMGTRKIHSIEAGLIQVADGCDMTKGRARIPIEINTKPTAGDIHKYSANSIERVLIQRGEERPIKIEVHMSAEVGFFQIEEVLMQKISQSPVQPLIELFACVDGQEMKQYL